MSGKKKEIEPVASRIQYELCGVVCETAISNRCEVDLNENKKIIEKQAYCDKCLFENHKGIIICLKNGNAFLDGGLKIRIKNSLQRFPCYLVYVNENFEIVDPLEGINGKNIFKFIRDLRADNPKLRLDASMTSGYCESEEMKQLLIELNVRGSYLDVFWH